MTQPLYMPDSVCGVCEGEHVDAKHSRIVRGAVDTILRAASERLDEVRSLSPALPYGAYEFEVENRRGFPGDELETIARLAATVREFIRENERDGARVDWWEQREDVWFVATGHEESTGWLIRDVNDRFDDTVFPTVREAMDHARRTLSERRDTSTEDLA